MKFTNPTAANLREWKKWVAERPACIREAVEKHKLDPWTLYKLKTTGQRVYITSFSENDTSKNIPVTVRVGVSGKFNCVTHERDVFGIDPADLEECDLPGPGEQLGSFDLPIEVLKHLHTEYPDADPPPHVMLDLISRYPLKQKK